MLAFSFLLVPATKSEAFALDSLWEYIYQNFDFQSGMGQKPGNVVFDPMDINYGIVPAIEIRPTLLNLQIGLNHHCFHEIDRNDFKTVYWNKLFLAAGSKNMRRYDYWLGLTKPDGWTFENRISWYLSWGYYLRKFFGPQYQGYPRFSKDELLQIGVRFFI